MTAAHDSMEYSVMTYRSYVGDPLSGGYANETWGYAQSLMMYDIAALQYMYGANYNTNSGDTTYTWSSTTGAMSVNGVNQGTPGGNRIFMTVWDGGGIDTYNFSNYSTNLTVSLAPGAWTTTSGNQLAHLDYWDGGSHFAAGNIANALLFQGNVASLIENAIGGSGNDTIVGNQAANVLTGNGGNDVLSGGDGDDQLFGNAGSDTLTGGNGADRFHFDNASSGADVVTDFADGVDLLVLSRTGFGLASAGSLAAAGVNFVNGMSPAGSGPTILFNFANGNVYWDNDGTGSGAASLLAQVDIESAGSYSLGTLPGWSYASTGDYNGDGTDDIVWRNSAGQNLLWLMDDNAVGQTADLGTIPGWEVLASADFNGDGTDDFIWHNASRGENFVWLMDDGQPYQSFYGGLIPGWNLASSEDLNGDNVDDLLWRNPSTGQNYLWLMDDGQPYQSFSLGVIPGWNMLASADFNGDGTSDLIWNNPSQQTNYIWLMDDGQPYASFFAGNIPGWNVAALGDFDNDGTDDILWQNSSSGQAYAWLMDGGQPKASFGIDQLNGKTVLGAGDYNNDGYSDFLWRDPATNVLHSLSMQEFTTPALDQDDFLVV